MQILFEQKLNSHGILSYICSATGIYSNQVTIECSSFSQVT